jgi:tetratricopeptide (TPR) repeat protein
MKGLINHSLYSTVTLVFLLWFTPVLGQVPTPEAAIQLAFQQSKTQAVEDPLIQRNNALNKVFKEEDNNFNRYWLSYGLYNQALIADRLEDKKAAEELIDRAIELLKPLKEDPESQALLALQLGYSTRFKSYWSMISLGRNAYQRAERAVALAPTNMRTNLALAINDFYTPKVFGGGKKVETHLIKALQAPSPSASDTSPTWGKPNVYELLVKYYQKNEQQTEAQNYLNQGLSEFPDSELLLSLKYSP